ncbi:MAG: hypothetical protein K5755_04345 [Clostridiales bacterium]|nr:hypothetical protein [Clostridiales bacterium]
MMNLNGLNIPSLALSAFERHIASGTFPHSSLIVGADEEKLLEVARFLSAALVCENDGAPCGQCPNCLKSEKNVHPDIRTVSPREKRKSVNMDECREMIMDSYVLPNEAQRKVYIVTSAQTLDEKVQNAMLKILEEPPQYVYFILLCTNPSAMLSTVMSRVSVFNVGNETETEDETARGIALNIIDALMKINEIELIRATVPLDRDRQLVKKTMECFKGFVNASLRARQGFGEDSTDMASRFTGEELMNLNSGADEIISACDRNANEKLLITLISALFRRAIGG